MPTARKLPSGSWHCTVFSHYEIVDGKKKRKYESFTCNIPGRQGKAECERMASEWAYRKKDRAYNITLIEAAEKYVAMKQGVLSPSTARSYTQYQKYLSIIGSIPIRSLSNADVQVWLSDLSQGRSPKTVRNVYGFLISVCKTFGRDDIKGTLPMKSKYRAHTPTDAEIKKLVAYLSKPEKADLRRAVMLSAFCSLRRGEICALTDKDIVGNQLHISKSIVVTPEGTWETKRPKTTDSDRYVDVPDFLMEELKQIKGHLVKCSPSQLTNRFVRAITFSGLEHFRFHDLRHYYVSISHALGIPDAYIMQNGGWKTDRVMKLVYLDTLSDRNAIEKAKLNAHFNAMQNEMQNDPPEAQQTQ